MVVSEVLWHKFLRMANSGLFLVIFVII